MTLKSGTSRTRALSKRTASRYGISFVVTAMLLIELNSIAVAKLRVAASITDLASIAASVGGDQVECFSISKPNADVHRVEVLPSYMVRVAKSDVYLKVGLQLDQWADQIIDGSRNDHLLVVDCSRDIDALEKPTGKVTALMGDIHPNGNPHYWLDPRNGGIVAREVATALGRLDPAHAADYQARADSLAHAADSELVDGQRTVAGLTSKTLITYHASWIYFAFAFGFEIAGTAEPVPGIPPTGKHLQELVDMVNQRGIEIFLQEPYLSDDAGAFLARETGLRVVKSAPSCDSATAGSYLEHLHETLQAIAAPGATTGSR